MNKNQSASILIIFLIGIILSACDKKEDEEANQNKPPVITNIDIIGGEVSWGSSCQICVEAKDPDPERARVPAEIVVPPL